MNGVSPHSRIFIDTDNACGSMTGDIDDAFAIAALLASPAISVTGICSVFGNTTAAKSQRNSETLARLIGSSVSLYAGAAHSHDEPSDLLNVMRAQNDPMRYAALGPLTNVAFLCRKLGPDVTRYLSEVVIVGANTSSLGPFPKIWPHEFNLAKDTSAVTTVLRSDLRLTLCPLDVVCRLKFSAEDLAALPALIQPFFQQHGRRWIARNMVLKQRRCFPVWDLVAAMYMIEPDLFEMEKSTARKSRLGKLVFGQGGRPVLLMKSFSPPAVKKAYFKLLSSFCAKHQQPR